MNTLIRFVKNESAATSIEYSMIAIFISIVFIIAVKGIGSTLNSNFTNVSNAFR